LEQLPRVFIGDEPNKVQVTKVLSVKIDQYQFLTWDSHIDPISKKIYSGVRATK
jgi:hypothetical protein